MKCLYKTAFFLSCATFSNAWAQHQSDNQAITDLLINADDYLELVQEQWPRIATGDLLAMSVSYTAINNCWHFKSEINASDNISDFEDILRQQRPREVVFGTGIYFKCRSLVNRLNEFPGWQDLRLRAALAGHGPSQIYMVLDFYRFRHERPRETVAFSPAGFLTEALVAERPMAFSTIGDLGVAFGIRKDRSETTSVAWILIMCKIRGDCGEVSSMANLCASLAPECAEFRTVYEMLEHRAGSEEQFTAAGRLADELFAKVKQRRFEELELELIW